MTKNKTLTAFLVILTITTAQMQNPQNLFSQAVASAIQPFKDLKRSFDDSAPDANTPTAYQVDAPFRRILPSNYEDSLSQPRLEPNPRFISNIVGQLG